MPHSLQDAPAVHLPIAAIPHAVGHRRATRIDGLERADAIVRGQSGGESGASRAQRLLPGQSVPGARGGQLLGLSGHWIQFLATAAMLRLAVACIIGLVIDGFTRRRTSAFRHNRLFGIYL